MTFKTGERVVYEETREFVPLVSLRRPGIYVVEVIVARPKEGTCLVLFGNYWREVVDITKLRRTQ